VTALQPTSPLQAVFAAPPRPLAEVELVLAAWRLRMTEQFDDLLCLAHLQGVKRLDYQIETVTKVLRGLRGRALLADEVGLGKTVEASLLIKEMLLRGMATRVLVLVPSALVGQWAEELRSKFQVEVRTTDDPGFRTQGAEKAWGAPGVVVASIHLAKHERNAAAVAAVAWDLVAVDEAHHVKNRATAGWKLINQLKSRHLLLLTATPVETDLEELYNLITLLKPGQLSTPADFKKRYVSSKDPLAPRNRDQLRELLSEVMIRNTRARAGLSIALPPRYAQTVVVEPSAEEQALYQGIVEAVRSTTQTPASAGLRRTLRFLLEAAGSGPQAVLDSLERAAARSPAEAEAGADADEPPAGLGPKAQKELVKLARAAAAAPSRKVQRLQELLAAMPGKAVVFSRFRATLDHLAASLQQKGVSFAAFHGGMSGPDKDAAVQRFREGARVLLATEVGGEGRNLQFANVLVNFDLPWNPMKIEQRIGRVHRIGQTQEVHIYSLCGAKTAEERILDVLDRRIHLFELVIGEVDLILGRAMDEQEFDARIFDIYARSRDEAAVAQGFDQLADELVQARSGYEKVKALDEQLFAEDFET
jgi:SNF2 family DNA or RNA helicase